MCNPPPCKEFKTFEEQADKLIARGLIANRDELITRLRAVNYYRFTGYIYIFRPILSISGTGQKVRRETYKDGTSLQLVWNYYLFDRRLRLLIIDAIERIEITLRTNIAHYWSGMTGMPNPQKNLRHYKPKFTEEERVRLLARFQKSFDRSTDDCVIHHKEDLHFRNVEDLPIWVFCELSTLGDLVWLFNGLTDPIKKQISSDFGIDDVPFFSSILGLICIARNACAHHARIWNRAWNTCRERESNRKNIIPVVRDTKLSDWLTRWYNTSQSWQHKKNKNHSFSRTSTAFLLTACHFLLKTSANTSNWRNRFLDLLRHPDTPNTVVQEMRFPEHWQEHPLWQ